MNVFLFKGQQTSKMDLLSWLKSICPSAENAASVTKKFHLNKVYKSGEDSGDEKLILEYMKVRISHME